MNRPLYAGIRTHNGVEYPGRWQAIFDAELWSAIQLRRRLRQAAAGERPQARKYLLTGWVYCGGCDLHLNGETKRDHPGRPLRRIYHCRVQGDTQKARGCGGVTRNADALEDFVIECLFYRLDSPELGKLLKEDAPDDGRLRTLLDRATALKLRINEIVDDYAAAVLTREQMTRAKTKADQELAKVEAEIEELNRQRTATGLIPVGQTVRQAWEKSDSDEWRRQLIDLVIEKIIVKPGISKPFYKGKWRFDPSLIEIVWRV